ncbi:MAG: hypothetical protein JO190_00620 [Candidatus Eremiobacteraeota bacterium]|nr:hypothetical protein [Candidatus Eremiobacteraeota bacterium]
MDYELACDRLCDDISQLLLDGPRPATKWKAFAAGRATQDLAAAFHRAAGRPEDELWSNALESLERFIDLYDYSAVGNPAAMRELRSFVDENADLLAPRLHLKLAS